MSEGDEPKVSNAQAGAAQNALANVTEQLKNVLNKVGGARKRLRGGRRTKRRRRRRHRNGQEE